MVSVKRQVMANSLVTAAGPMRHASSRGGTDGGPRAGCGRGWRRRRRGLPRNITISI